MFLKAGDTISHIVCEPDSAKEIEQMGELELQLQQMTAKKLDL